MWHDSETLYLKVLYTHTLPNLSLTAYPIRAFGTCARKPLQISEPGLSNKTNWFTLALLTLTRDNLP